MISRRKTLQALGTGGIVTAAGCLGTADENGASSDVRIGALTPVSGPFEPLGESQRAGIDLAIESLQDDEEFPAVSVVHRDTEASPSVGRSQAVELIDDEHVDLLVGTISSDVAPPLNHLAQEREILFAPGAASDTITGRECSDYAFRVETSVNQIAMSCAPWTLDNLGTNVWFHLMDYEYGESIINEWRSRMVKSSPDLDLAGVSRSPPGTQEFGNYLDRIAEAEPDVLTLGMIGGDLNAMLGQLIERGLHEETAVIATTGSFRITRLAVGAAADGIYSGVRYDPALETGDNPAFVEAYEEQTGQPPDNFSRAGYDSVRMLAAGIREAGTTDADAVADALAGSEFQSVLGTVRVRECDHQAMVPTWVGRLQAAGEAANVELLERFEPEATIPPCEQIRCNR